MTNFETFKKTIELLQAKQLRYWVFGGYALEGVRGNITREHDDIDIYLNSEDINKFIELLNSSGYNCYKREQMYFIDSPDLKIGVLLLTEEDNYFVANGNCTLAKYPKEMFSEDIDASINGFKFRIVPKEILAFEYEFSRHQNDKDYARTLNVNKELIDKIKIVKIRDSKKNTLSE